MARRKSRRLLVTGVVSSADLAKSVITNYIDKARTEIATWSRHYRASITTYATSTETEYVKRREEAEKKLGAWYDVYKEVVYPEIIGAFSRGKAEFAKRVKPAVSPTPPA